MEIPNYISEMSDPYMFYRIYVFCSTFEVARYFVKERTGYGTDLLFICGKEYGDKIVYHGRELNLDLSVLEYDKEYFIDREEKNKEEKC